MGVKHRTKKDKMQSIFAEKDMKLEYSSQAHNCLKPTHHEQKLAQPDYYCSYFSYMIERKWSSPSFHIWFGSLSHLLYLCLSNFLKLWPALIRTHSPTFQFRTTGQDIDIRFQPLSWLRSATHILTPFSPWVCILLNKSPLNMCVCLLLGCWVFNNYININIQHDSFFAISKCLASHNNFQSGPKKPKWSLCHQHP